MKEYDIIILGGGPGGYVAAIRAAQLNAKVALIEKNELGGVCLNWGCIPTKALLKSAKVYKQFMHAEEYGLSLLDKDSVKIDWKSMINRKDEVVKKLTGGVKGLLKKNKVDVYNGIGIVIDKSTLTVNDETLKTKKLIIATGSRPFIPPIIGIEKSFENKIAVTSKELLSLDVLPKSLTIIGGGVIGIEFATLFSTLGTKVTIFERGEQILEQIDNQVRKTYFKILKNDNLVVHLNTSVVEIKGNEVFFSKDGIQDSIVSDKILVSTGMTPNIEGLEALKLEVTKSGIVTNNRLETNVSDVYAIGDVNGKMMLAHVASAEGIVAVENIMGKHNEIDYGKVPSGIYGFPEIAYVGLTEQEAVKRGLDFKISTFPLSANGKALAEGESEGFIKIISDVKYGELIGMHILAPNATDMIAEAVTTMELEGTVFELAKAIHPHPTLSEIVMEAAQSAVNQTSHKF